MIKSSAQAARLNTGQLTILALLFAFSMLSYFDRTIMSIAGPELMKDFSLSATQIGSVNSAFILVLRRSAAFRRPSEREIHDCSLFD
jgi:sugar phosphate permease